MEQLTYLDNTAITETRPEVVKSMLPYFTEYYDNPSLAYSFSTESKRAANHAREITARPLGTKTNEIYSTAGGSEVDSWALVAMAEAYGNKERHITTTKTKHHAILHTYQCLKERGYEVTYPDVDENEVVRLDELKKAVRPDTILVSVTFANNEAGTTESIKETGAVVREHGILFHIDTIQASVHTSTDVGGYNIDMFSFSGHKLNGLKGIGFLYARISVKTRSFIHGDAQERKRCVGAENVPGIVRHGKTVELAMVDMEEWVAREAKLRDYLMKWVMDEVPPTRIDGSHISRPSDNVNFASQFTESKSLLIKLGMAGICGSSDSACTSEPLGLSHVLLAIGLPHEIVHGSLRLILSGENMKEEMDYVTKQIKGTVGYLRGMLPLYEDYIKHSDGGRK